jgi:7-cyano-7-deazaguanine synthase
MASRSATACLLVSGGLDSGFLLQQLLRQRIRVLPLYLRCGFRWEAAELHWLRRFLHAVRTPRLAPLRVVALPVRSIYGNHWSLSGRRVPAAGSPDDAVYLPGRNVLLVGCAAVVCARQRIPTIALGVLRGNPFGDASPRVLDEFARVLTHALGHSLRVLTPLIRWRKTTLIRRAAGLPLELTFSCLQPRGLWHCGRCNKCGERKRGFRLAGVADPTRYAS